MKKTLFGSLLFAFATLPLLATDVSGNWRMKANAGNREATLEISLRQNGGSLTGSVSGPRRLYPIAKGSVDDSNHIQILLGGRGPLAGAKITGTVDGDHLRLIMQAKKGQSEGLAERSR